MKISDLIVDLEKYIFIGEDIDITGLTHNSKDCNNGYLYFVISGRNDTGANYINEAINNGAVAIVTESKINVNIPQIIVDNSREAMSLISKKFYDDACDKLNIVGIVGTNGKTTCSYIIKSILQYSGYNIGVIGTNGVYIGNKYINEELTTPDPINLHEYFYDMVSSGIKYCVMEVSAHAIDLYKVAGIRFSVGLFTNISNEHLDYFDNMGLQ